jgi:hypothetical protein
LRTTNAIERWFVEVRCRTRPIVMFYNQDKQTLATGIGFGNRARKKIG